MDVNSEGRQAQNRPERERQREEVMMERRVCEGPEEAGQREESRAQLVSSVCQCKSFSGVRRGAMERHTDAPRMMEVTESYQAQSWPWPLFLCSVCQSTIYLFIYFFTADVEGSFSKETLILSFMTSFCYFIYKKYIYFQQCVL